MKVKFFLTLLFISILIASCDRKPDLAYLDACAHPDALKEIKYYVKHKISDADGLIIAAKKNTNEKIVKELLKSKNIEEGQRLEALWYSMENKNIEVFKVLLKDTNGANSFRDKTKETILMQACESNREEIVKILIKNDADVNARDAKGKTALMIACDKGNKDIVNVLLAAGADVKIKDNNSATALIYSLKSVSVKNVLLKAGADPKEISTYFDFKMLPIPGRNFEMLSTEVTQELYLKIIGTNPSKFKGDNLPVEQVSWYDAVKFCNALSQKMGLTPVYTINGNKVTQNTSANGFRLPTVEEWQYAAKGGENYSYAGSDNIDDVAWYGDNSGYKTHPVAQKSPMAMGYMI